MVLNNQFLHEFFAVTRFIILQTILSILSLLGLMNFGQPLPAEEPATLAQEAYLKPPAAIADAVLGLQTNNQSMTNLSPNGKVFVLERRELLPPLERLAAPNVYLAELAIDPIATRSRDIWVRSGSGFDLFSHEDKRTVPVQIPDGARVSNPVWSPDGSQLGFFAHFPNATYIHVADGQTGVSRRVCDSPVLATLTTQFQWSRDGQKLMAVLRPDDGSLGTPKPPTVATEPKVRVARDGNQPSRTYRYLLESPHDMRLLEHLVNGQLALVNVGDGQISKIGNPRLIRSITMSPDGERFRVTTVKKPFSYYFPFTRFGSLEEVWGADGKSFVVLADQNLRESTSPTPTPPTPNTGRPGRTNRPGSPTPNTNPPVDPNPTDPDPKTDPKTDPMDPVPDPDTPRRPAPQDPDAKRDLNWRPDGAGLCYLQLAEAKSKNDTSARNDRVLLWVPPFGKTDVKTVYETKDRISTLQYSEDARWMFLTQTIDNQRRITAVDLKDTSKFYIVYKSAGRSGTNEAAPRPVAKTANGDEAAPRPVAKTANGDDEQSRRGGSNFAFSTVRLLTRDGLGGVQVVRLSPKDEVYLLGSERSSGGENRFSKPTLDRVQIVSGKKERIFEGTGETFETITGVDGDRVTAVFTTRQKTDQVPDTFKTIVPKGATTKLTNNTDPAPWQRNLKVERIRITRVDGFKFWAKVTLPPNAPKKLPAMFWIYPREYTDQASYDSSAGRTQSTSGRFSTPSPRSMTMLTLLGYAVVEPDVPIVGPTGRMNDNYISDLRNGLWAVIDELDRREIIDRSRLAIGGHSYGAFSTANALAHTPFFKAGIAGDGNYNRTLTSMTFQTERRQLWDARETYLEMSPLLWANRINGALLMYHGMEDANVGTNPVNAEHLFMALDGLGKPASLYMYPYEAHGPIARETTLDLWARWVAWLDKYVKNATPSQAGK